MVNHLWISNRMMHYAYRFDDYDVQTVYVQRDHDINLFVLSRVELAALEVCSIACSAHCCAADSAFTGQQGENWHTSLAYHLNSAELSTKRLRKYLETSWTHNWDSFYCAYPFFQEGKEVDLASRLLGSLWSAAEDVWLFYHQVSQS